MPFYLFLLLVNGLFAVILLSYSAAAVCFWECIHMIKIRFKDAHSLLYTMTLTTYLILETKMVIAR